MEHQHDGEHSTGLLGALWRHLKGRSGEDEVVDRATDHIVQIADPTIRQVKRYRQVLHDPVVGAMRYFRTLIEDIPGPVVLDRSHYFDDPTVKALFASPEELEETLRFSPEVNKLRKQGVQGNMVAMMTMEQNERTIFGYKQDGEMLQRDVRQQAISFTDHRIVAPALDMDTTKAGIVNRGLEVLAMAAMERITTLRANKAELEGKKEYLKGMVKILGGKSHRQEMFAAPTPRNREELRKVEQMLAEVNQELETLRKQIAQPEQALAHLETIMRNPEKMLTARSQHYRLDWKGVRVDDEPGSEGNDIVLAEFAMEELHRSATLVTFSLTAG